LGSIIEETTLIGEYNLPAILHATFTLTRAETGVLLAPPNETYLAWFEMKPNHPQ
jgi:hypothetical protein